jgi:hydrogenase maturation factor
LDTSLQEQNEKNVSGIPRDAAACIWEGAAPGLEIIFCGYAALEETKRILEKELPEKALERIPERIRERVAALVGKAGEAASEAEKILASAAEKERLLYAKKLSGQSIRSILWEIPESAGIGISADLRSIPIRQETVEIFELAGKDPYEAPCSDLWVILSLPEAGSAEALREAGLPAAKIGETTGGHDKLLRSGDHISYLNRPQKEG